MELVLLCLILGIGASIKLYRTIKNIRTTWVETETNTVTEVKDVYVYRPRPRRSLTAEEVRLAREIDELTK